MTKKAPDVNAAQGTMLQEAGPGSFAIGEIFPSDPRDKLLGYQESAVFYGEPGTSVDIAQRAEYLQAALSAFGRRNQRVGFDTASNVRQYNAPIWARYREAVPKVQEGAQANVDRFEYKAKLNFWRATGLAALRGRGLAPNKEIDAIGRKMWREFSTQYGDPDKREKRDNYIRTLKKSVRVSQKIIKKTAA